MSTNKNSGGKQAAVVKQTVITLRNPLIVVLVICDQGSSQTERVGTFLKCSSIGRTLRDCWGYSLFYQTSDKLTIYAKDNGGLTSDICHLWKIVQIKSFLQEAKEYVIKYNHDGAIFVASFDNVKDTRTIYDSQGNVFSLSQICDQLSIETDSKDKSPVPHRSCVYFINSPMVEMDNSKKKPISVNEKSKHKENVKDSRNNSTIVVPKSDDDCARFQQKISEFIAGNVAGNVSLSSLIATGINSTSQKEVSKDDDIYRVFSYNSTTKSLNKLKNESDVGDVTFAKYEEKTDDNDSDDSKESKDTEESMAALEEAQECVHDIYVSKLNGCFLTR